MYINDYIIKNLNNNDIYFEFEGKKIKILFEDEYKARLIAVLAYSKLYNMPAGKEVIDILEGIYSEEVFKTGVFMSDHLLVTMTKDKDINYLLLEPNSQDGEYTNFIVKDYNNHNSVLYGHIYEHIQKNYVHQTEIIKKEAITTSLRF
jgi:hypothetical protein